MPVNQSKSTIQANTAVRTFAEVAEMVGTSEANVRQTEYRALRKLKAAISLVWFEDNLLDDSRGHMRRNRQRNFYGGRPTTELGEWLREHCEV